MPFTVLSHTADTGVEATAADLASLIGELARGMFATIGLVDPCSGARLAVRVSASSEEDLVVDVLSELLYRAETRDLVMCAFEVTQMGPCEVSVTATGAHISAVDVVGPAIKAVTYHGLEISHDQAGWYGRVFFDV